MLLTHFFTSQNLVMDLKWGLNDLPGYIDRSTSLDNLLFATGLPNEAIDPPGECAVSASSSIISLCNDYDGLLALSDTFTRHSESLLVMMTTEKVGLWVPGHVLHANSNFSLVILISF